MTQGISHTPRPQVLSLPERLDADTEATGRGVSLMPWVIRLRR